MKKRIIPLLFMALFSAFIIFANTQLDNIKGIWYTVKYNNDEIDVMISQNNSVIKQGAEEILGYNLREYTKEELQQIENGNITEDKIIENIIREEFTNKKSDVNFDATVEYYITELYRIKDIYIGILDSMVKSAVSDYRSLSKTQKTRSKQLEIGASYAAKAVKLEEEADAKVNEILNKIEICLKKDGKSLEIINKISDAYTKEKTLKRAYYLNMFK